MTVSSDSINILALFSILLTEMIAGCRIPTLLESIPFVYGIATMYKNAHHDAHGVPGNITPEDK
jgi:hypothetical protein